MLGRGACAFDFVPTQSYTHVCMLKHMCAHMLVGKKIEIWIPRIATNFHGFSFAVRAFCAFELCNLAHNPSPLFDILDGSSLLECIKHIQWSWKLKERSTLQVFIGRRDHFE